MLHWSVFVYTQNTPGPEKLQSYAAAGPFPGLLSR